MRQIDVQAGQPIRYSDPATQKTAPMGHAFFSDAGQESWATGVQQSPEKPRGQLPQFQRARMLN
jgi:hypothetical protein